MSKRYGSGWALLAATLAGYGLGEADFGPAHAAVQDVKHVTVSVKIPNSNATISDIWTKTKAALCDDVETEAGLDPGDCSIEPGASLYLERGEDRTLVRFTAALDGTWTKGAPQ